jgi:hypothetical protein
VAALSCQFVPGFLQGFFFGKQVEACVEPLVVVYDPVHFIFSLFRLRDRTYYADRAAFYSDHRRLAAELFAADAAGKEKS